MKFKRRYANEIDLEVSKITPQGQVVYSHIQSEIEPSTGREIHTIQTVDAQDVIEQIKYLKNNAPIYYATGELIKLHKAILENLHDLWAAIKANDPVSDLVPPDPPSQGKGHSAAP